MRLKSILIISIATLFFFYEFYLRIIIGSYQTELMNFLNLNFKEFSFLSSTIFCFIYGIMQIPVGILLNRVGLKKTMLFGCSFCLISCIGFSYIKTYSMSLFWRALMAFGSSFGFISLLMCIKNWGLKQRTALIIGISQCLSTLSSVALSNFLATSKIIKNLNWRDTFFYSGVFGIIIFFLILIFIKNNTNLKLSKITKSTSLFKAFLKPQPYIVSILSSSIYFVIEYLTENNGRRFLYCKNLDSTSAALIITVSWLGYSLGNPLLGFISDYFKTRKKIIVSCSLIGLVAILLIIYSFDFKLLFLGFLLLGISASGQTIGYANIADIYKGKDVSIGFSIENSMITVVSIFITSIVSIFIDFFNQRNSLLISYQYSFNIFIFMYIFVFFGSIFFIRESLYKKK